MCSEGYDCLGQISFSRHDHRLIDSEAARINLNQSKAFHKVDARFLEANLATARFG